MAETPSSPLDSIGQLVAAYDIPPERRSAAQALYALADTLRLLDERTPHEGAYLAENCRAKVDALLAEMQSGLDAVIGPLIGSQLRAIEKAEQDAETACELHARRLEIMRKEDKSAVFDELVTTGWDIPFTQTAAKITREAWAADPFEQMLSKQEEENRILGISYQATKVRALFERFVTKPGKLGKKDQD